MWCVVRQCLPLAARFARDAEGATAIEYAVIGGLVACGIIAGALALGGNLNTMYLSFSGKVPAVN